MTKLRLPCTFPDAVTRVCDRLGYKEAAAIVGLSERTVRNWSDPDTGVTPQIRDCLKLDLAYAQAGGEGFPMLQSYQLQVETEYAAARSDAIALAIAAATVAKEGGEATAALIHASLPGATRADRLRAKQELQESIAAQTNALPMLEEETKPAAPP